MQQNLSYVASSKSRSDQRTSAGDASQNKRLSAQWTTAAAEEQDRQIGSDVRPSGCTTRVHCPRNQYQVRASDSCKLPPNTTNQPPSTAITTGRQKARKACICKFSLLQVSSTKAKRPKFHINKSASDKTNWLQTSHLILNFPPPNISLKAQPKQFN